jgi:hypothetical protein
MKKLFFLLLLGVLIISSCTPVSGGDVPHRGNEDNIQYIITEIEGMPCIYASGSRMAALTCDWSKYRGPVE